MRLERVPDNTPRSNDTQNMSCFDYTQNMSCRPRTTVNSKGLSSARLPVRLKGRNVLITPLEYIPTCLAAYSIKYPEMSVPVFNAILSLGNRRRFKTYKRFIMNHSGHEQSLMGWLSSIPEDIIELPRVGHVRRDGKVDFKEVSVLSRNLHKALYIMARSNRYVYIRDKSPLLSLVSVSRRIQIIFVSQGGE